ncbi:MAG: alpha/beta hydrolase [Rhodanobacteraceae bacterium]
MATQTDRSPWKRMLWRRLRGLGMLLLILVAIAAGVYLLAPQWIVRVVEWRQASTAGLESHELSVDGQDWVYYEGGSGPTIVLLHGFGGSRDNWTRVAGDLTGNFRVVIPDLPGWGQSMPVPGSDYGPRAQAKRLAGFIDRVAPRNLVLIGHSMGGLIAGLYAADHLDHVAAVGFVDSGGVDHLKSPLKEGRNPFAYTDRAGFEQVMDLAFADPPQLPGRIEDVFVKRNADRLDMIKRSFAAMARADASGDLPSVLPRIDKPALVMWCHDDKLVSSDAVDVFRKDLTASPRIDVTTLFGCSHMPMLENPHATAQAITRFMLPPHPR